MSTRSTHENQQQFSQENLRKKNSHQNLRGKCRTKFLGKIWEQNFPGMFIYWIYWFSHMEKRFLTHERTSLHFTFFFLFTHESKFLSLVFPVPHLLSVHLMDKWKNYKLFQYFTRLNTWNIMRTKYLWILFFLSHSKIILKENIFNSVTHIKKKKHFRTWKKMEHKKKFAGPFSPDRRIEGVPQHTRATHSRL